MKLAVPELSLRMVESKTRKAAFLREVIRSLDLSETIVEAVRFEELLIRPAMHDSADVVTMRAVRVDQKTLTELQSFIRPGGLLFLFGAGSLVPSLLAVPQLLPSGSHVLLSHWGSRLDVLQKAGS